MTMELTADKVIPSCVFTDEKLHTSIMMFPTCLVLGDSDDVAAKYNLNGRYGDCLDFHVENLPKEIVLPELVVKDGGLVNFISLRAMHRIVFSEISIDNFHFFINDDLRRTILDYDKSHGNFFSYLINKEQYPKNLFTIRVHLAKSNDTAIGAVDHIEEVFSLDTHEAGLLAYCHDLENGNNYTFYIDDTNSSAIELAYGVSEQKEEEKATPAEDGDSDGEV